MPVASAEQSPTVRLFTLLHTFVFCDWHLVHGELRKQTGRDPRKEERIKRRFAPRRRRLAAAIDRELRRGAQWPCLDEKLFGPDYLWRPPTQGIERPQSPRPYPGYCVRWNGAFWEICKTQGERKAAGFISLAMTWTVPFPQPGEYIISGARARFAYRICEVERYDTPRTHKRFTCRLWCERVDPQRIPRKANVLPFTWHSRDVR